MMNNQTRDAAVAEPENNADLKLPRISSHGEEQTPKTDSVKRIVLVDDHPAFRHGVAQLLADEADLEICGEADSLPQAMQAVRSLQPDLVTVDISLNGPNGIELVKHLKSEFPRLSTLVISMHDENVYALRALKAGAMGYLMKTVALHTIVDAIRCVLSGHIYTSPSLSEHFLVKMVRDTATTSPLDILTDRELEVFHLIGEGRSTREIAAKLHLSTKTIESHRLHIKQKLDLKNAAELVRFAVEWLSLKNTNPVAGPQLVSPLEHA